MIENACCFTGHRQLTPSEIPEIKKRLAEEIESLIQKGVTEFLCGGALGFDTLAALSVLNLKKIYPQIKLNLVLPCQKQSKNWNPCDIAVYEQIQNQVDTVHYTALYYYKGCMHTRNRYLISHSSFCICYIKNTIGGTAYTVQYANKFDLNIKNLATP